MGRRWTLLDGGGNRGGSGWRDAYFVILDDVKDLERCNDVLRFHHGSITDFLDRHGGSRFFVSQQVDENLTPIASVAEKAKVTKRLFRTPGLLLDFRQFIGEID